MNDSKKVMQAWKESSWCTQGLETPSKSLILQGLVEDVRTYLTPLKIKHPPL
jgi:hypothetical protein